MQTRLSVRWCVAIVLVTFNLLLAFYTFTSLDEDDSDATSKESFDDLVRETNYLIARLHSKGLLDAKDVPPDEDKSPQGQVIDDTANNIERDWYAGNEKASWDTYEQVDNRQEFFYVMQPGSACERDSFLLIVVCSAVQHFDRRQAIRDTWGGVTRKRHLASRVVFMLGLPGAEYQHLETHVLDESKEHGDIIQEAFVDSYQNLTVKSIGALRWAAHFCRGVKYVMKVDDDVYLNTPNLIQVLVDLQRFESPRFILGHLIHGARPIANRNSKWYTPTTLFKSNTYPKYLSGTAYVISGNIVQDMLRMSESVKQFWLEDVFITGILPTKVGAVLLNNNRFIIRKLKPHPCLYKMAVSAHEVSATEMYEMWRRTHQADLDCTDSVVKFRKWKALDYA